MRGSILCAVASCLASSLTAGSALAVTAVSNLGETRFGDNIISGPVSSNPSVTTGNQFTVGAGSWSINSVTLSLRDVRNTSPDSFKLEVRDAVSGLPGTTVLGSFNVAANDVAGAGFSSYTYAPSAPFSLSPGSYYLVGTALPAAGLVGVQWSNTASLASPGLPGWSIDSRQASQFGSGAWTLDGAQLRLQFSVDATNTAPIPEPATLAGLAGLTVLTLRRR
jgi:hypothetical protein